MNITASLKSKLIIGLLSFIFLSCHGQQDISFYLDSLQNKGKLNGNILVVKDGNALIERSFGYAKGDKKELLTLHHRFNIGSIYKEFPAVGIMMLKEKGLLDIDDKINSYLKWLPDWSSTISIKQLLQYSGGLPKIRWNAYFGNGLTITDKDIMNDLMAIETLEYEPGSDYLYTNYSPVLLIKIIENITKEKFEVFVKNQLFEPFGMKNLVLKPAYPYEDGTLMAFPFDTNYKEDQYQLEVPYLLFSSTVWDLYHWLQKLHSFQIISKASVKLLSQNVDQPGNIQSPLGYCEWEENNVIEHSHHGSSGNYEGIIRNFPKEGLTIIVLTNQKHSNVREISDTVWSMVRK